VRSPGGRFGEAAETNRLAACAPRIMTTRSAMSFHSVESLLQQREIAWVAQFFASIIDPLLLQRILRRTVALVEDAEDARER
jgi:hypothetical protein